MSKVLSRIKSTGILLKKVISRRRHHEDASGIKELAERSKLLIEEIKIPQKTISKIYSTREGYQIIETYPVYEPFASINIVEDKDGQVYYEVVEASLTDEEQKLYEEIKNHLLWEIKPISSPDVNTVELVRTTAKRIIREFQIRFTRTPTLSWNKILYYVERDTVGYGPLDPIFRDYNVEDISCNGPGRPIYVWHRKYESIPTNIVFESAHELDNYVIKLANMSGKHISVAYPVVDAILPGGHRLAATFMKEVSTSGSTFTIRKFSETPLTIVDLIIYKTVSPELAAYFWLAMDYKMTTLILGVTGAGKTSTLNALATLLRPTYKIVTIEDTPELKLPHQNWVQLVSRPSYIGSSIGEISLFHLVKLSLRYRPDVIIVGEVRGEEAYVLFQAIATGHSGITTLHAESIDAAVKRLTSPPMNIPSSYIPLVNIALVIKRVQIRDERGRIRPARRVTNVWEILDYNKYREVSRWDPVNDRIIVDLKNSLVIDRIKNLTGLSEEAILNEIRRRERILKYLAEKRISSYRDVAKAIYRYYIKPETAESEIGVISA